MGAPGAGAALGGTLVSQGPVGMILAEIDGSNPATGTDTYYLHDNIGSTRGVYDSYFIPVSLGDFEYTPYGEAYTDDGPSTITHRFTGLDMDAQTGKYYAPYRYYDPNIARWMTQDPLGMLAGPNVYAYVRNRPNFYLDSLGLVSDNCIAMGIVCGIAIAAMVIACSGPQAALPSCWVASASAAMACSIWASTCWPPPIDDSPSTCPPVEFPPTIGPGIP